jgi:cobalamin biosynthesis protein CobT
MTLTLCLNSELRSYVNVIEDTRIDKLIQAKYPGVVRNYENGFDILEKQNFFGINGRDINKDFMIIDKINLRSKSLNRLPFIFAPIDNDWLAKVDAVKTFDDVLTLAKEMLDWQKEQVEEMKKLPDFDMHPMAMSYDLQEDEDDDGFGDDDQDEQDGGQGSDSDAEENDDAEDEKNDFNNFGHQNY